MGRVLFLVHGAQTLTFDSGYLAHEHIAQSGLLLHKIGKRGIIQLDQMGVFGRTLDDVALLADALGGFDPVDDASYARPRPHMLEGARSEAAASVKIVPARSGLSLAVDDLRDPVAVGKELTYEIRVSNIGQESQRKVVVEATIPAGMIPAPTLVRTLDPAVSMRMNPLGASVK